VIPDIDLARRLVDSQFPQCRSLPVKPVDVDGVDNRTFRLGDELTVRMPSGDWYARQVEKEHRWLPVLAPHLPLPIPIPVARGEPEHGYPYPWSIYRWLDGDLASLANIRDLTRFATDLAGFLVALKGVDATGGPEPGKHNFFRGGPLTTYADETLRSIERLGPEIPRDAVLAVWEEALAAAWTGKPVWFHGDVATGNLLVGDGALSAVIDFGTSGVGDPACDVVIAWTFLSGPSRSAFRSALGVDAGTWARGRGWALWKALISLVDDLERDSPRAGVQRHTIREIVADPR
jgi:aminoglycoside phosphotransferase (APT) family kinase protein